MANKGWQPMKLKEDPETLALIQEAKGGDLAARDRLIAENRGLIIRVANDFRSYGIDKEDLWQEGAIAILYAIKTFNQQRGQWRQHLAIVIAQHMRAYCRDNASTIRTPLWVLMGRGRLRKLSVDWRSMSASEVAAILGVCHSMATTILEMPPTTEHFDEHCHPMVKAESCDRWPEVRDLMDRVKLSQRQCAVVCGIYGLNGAIQETPEELGRRSGLKPRGVTSALTDAMRKLRGKPARPSGLARQRSA